MLNNFSKRAVPELQEFCWEIILAFSVALPTGSKSLNTEVFLDNHFQKSMLLNNILNPNRCQKHIHLCLEQQALEDSHPSSADKGTLIR